MAVLNRRDLGLILSLFLLLETLEMVRDRLDPDHREHDTFELEARAPGRFFSGWRPASGSRRVSNSTVPSILLDYVPLRAPIDAFVLELNGSSAGGRRISAKLNDQALGSTYLPAARGSSVAFLVDRAHFVNDRPNRLELRPEPEAIEAPPHWITLASLKVRPAPTAVSGISFGDDLYFGPGFSGAENGWRWSDGTSARLKIPLNRPLRTASYRLEVLAGTYGRRTATWRLNGETIGATTFDGWEPAEASIEFEGTRLRSGINELEVELDSVFEAEGDKRALGIAVRWLAILEKAAE